MRNRSARLTETVSSSVEEIKTDDNGLTRYATIIPKTDITQLVEVFVITDFTIVD